MGIEPTWERLHAPTPDLKSGSPTSELGASEMLDIYCFYELGNLPRMIDLYGALPKKNNHSASCERVAGRPAAAILDAIPS